ncbi:MAG: peptidase U32 family protein [Verrucomicrobiota bacterium]
MNADLPTNPTGRTIELMAPAGSRESLSAALKAGADSVYFGVGNLNMRARSANNFQSADLREITAKCRKYKAKAYLTLNTILFDEELGEAKSLCQKAKASGVDAIIAADPAVLQIARDVELPIHLSVQANVTNLAAVQFYSQYADVIVLARELSLDQIRGIIDGIRDQQIHGPSGKLIQIEIFAHGALCVAYSGKCQMSLALYGPKASASRGACFQPCRRNYLVTDQESGNELVIDGHQVISPKDLCTLPFLDQILDAGVSVLKLEGRGRSADFVSTVVRVYREAIDAWKDGTFSLKRESGAWMDELSKVFHRGFWEGGYYLGKQLGDWAVSSNSQAAEKKVFIGKITKYYSRIGVAETLVIAEPIKLGDELWILGETTGAVRAKATELRTGEAGTPSTRADKGELVAFPVPEKVREGDQLYRIVPTGL